MKPMNWILDHIQFAIAAAAAFAYWVNQMKGRARGGKDAAPMERRFEPARADADDLERTRRIQDEIRRKIAERRGVAAPPPPAPAQAAERSLAPPIVAPRPVAGQEGGLRERLETKLAQMQAREQARVAARDRRRQLEAQMRSIEADKLVAQRRAAEITLAARVETRAAATTQTAADTLAARHSRAWLDDLRDPQSARRAMVLREVLGPPVGLR